MHMKHCLLCNHIVGFVFANCPYVFPACPAEMLPTLWLNTERLPVLTGRIQVRLVMFTTGLLTIKYGRLVLVLMACLEVES